MPWLLMQRECTISLGYKKQANSCLHQELIVNTQDICGPVVINCQQLEIGRGGNFIPQKSANATNQGFPQSPRPYPEFVCRCATGYETQSKTGILYETFRQSNGMWWG